MLSGLQYLKHNLYHYPTAFVSTILGIAAPVIIFVVYPIRYEMGYRRPLHIPKSFPVPNRARNFPVGFGDE
ncbi:hypothetical protein BATDEDRAFT_91230 [Batrachochytrium dendrobatidis JAM81]|uniref:NADH-ubiquinone oxidoreductase 9.5 kDa subunit n=1 Tax=Batrachochytrium dendrobatidis (strain JAM81 / FGSC 10211) TaxID=684364 RepID=F4P9P9_BATDJ|nr:uncharacterized protein BATDEDRAFT_91230 [Batrachochytrium dendrobatidis JAM81]EGF77956.1 hypothetical protein BATDEDRAFT_91230 [Batrachochytrium dendrobatidis JAM81]|eukprot:XP_006681526.1 hypothetical protein BATDEDRAFT_91230 [Batrachochytrium dendrobatidis JAM81]